jgi:hypothetical protein
MGDGAKKEKNKKRKRKFDEDESPESMTLPVRVVGKKTYGYSSFQNSQVTLGVRYLPNRSVRFFGSHPNSVPAK